ncbi:hypothetical protein WH95_00565 [Kiloniella litopenaei]|uniref:Lipoprotein n=1 Tax=Kiloniella litopenaei TaxID=1549748 RepID=A0A0M2RGD3_9PROT|nr:hypothetical protein WH95_00565 [Kiloniella litopenaei]
MRILLSLALLLILANCQTTRNPDTTPLKTNTTTSNSRHYPLDMAQSVTNNADLKHALKVGNFKKYDQQTLDLLASDQRQVDIPGKAIIYRFNYQFIINKDERQEVADILDGLKSQPRTPPSRAVFFNKLKTHIVNMTSEEASQIAICVADYTWNDFPSNQKEIYNKMSTGINITSEDNVSLTYRPAANNKIGKITKPVKCIIEAIGLFDEFKTHVKVH